MKTFKGLMFALVAMYLASSGAVETWAGDKPLSPQAQILKGLLSSLKEHPQDKTIQSQYLRAFPADIKGFKSLFNQPDFSELYYDEAEYVSMVGALADERPEDVGRLLIGLSKDATTGPDALSDLQQVSIDYALKHTSQFAKLMNAQPKKNISGVVRFLADVENHEAYPEYSQLIEKLHSANEPKLARQFEAARTERMRQKGHGELRDEPSSPGGV